MKLTKKIKEILSKALDQNILCYDDDAPDNVLTSRLVEILKQELYVNYKENISHIYIDSNISVHINNLFIHPSFRIIAIKNLTRCFFSAKHFSLAPGDNNVVLAIGHNNTQILGSC